MNVTANAVLLEIGTPGQPDDYGNPSGYAAAWTGRAPAYLKRTRRSVLSGGQQVAVHTDVLLVLAGGGAPPAEIAGPDWEASSVLVEDRRTPTPVTRRFNVTLAENRAAGTIVDSIRLELDSERVA